MSVGGSSKFDQISNMLAALTANGDYSYIDRLGYSNSKELALFYLREATRAFHALKRSPPRDIHEEVKKLLEDINSDFLDLEIKQLAERGDDTRTLREMISLICSRALAKSSKFVT